VCVHYYYMDITASFPEQPWQTGVRKVKLV